MLSIQTRCFIAIVETGSITAAAEQLNMVKSSISQNLKNLETQLGATLISRTTRINALTAIGKNYYHHCKNIAQMADAAMEDVYAYNYQPSGAFRITAPHAAVETHVSYAIEQLLEKYPNLKPVLTTDDQRLDLIEHSIDVAISVGQLNDSTYKARRIGTLTDVLCVSPSFLQKQQYAQDSINDTDIIVKWPYISHIWQGDTITHPISTESDTSHKITFKPSIQANTIGSVKSLVLKGLGVGFLPKTYIQNELQNGQLRLVLEKHINRQSPIFAVHTHAAFVPKAVTVFIDALQETLG
ncbi:LysR family transcriptional regulator [Marinicella sp. W31]|uniref:LysR family transcriptional regulator n=1 Tax=Marinicella sp. W31 TaxID=3023713 RepID=UPI00375645AC